MSHFLNIIFRSKQLAKNLLIMVPRFSFQFFRDSSPPSHPALDRISDKLDLKVAVI
tara:strand:+ start:427 stop:594 length:168 start_codon:yes stop_codon:yes gene_type:complete